MRLRRQFGFLERCYNPESAAEITLQPLRRFPFDAEILLLIFYYPFRMGADLHFREGKGPQIDKPVRSEEDVAALKSLSERDLPSPMQAIRLCREKTDKPILGFAGAPFTYACYNRGWWFEDGIKPNDSCGPKPEAFKQLLDKLAVAVGKHLQAQVNAGALAVQLFDTWAGALSRADYVEFALPAVQKVFSMVSGAPTLYLFQR